MRILYTFVFVLGAFVAIAQGVDREELDPVPTEVWKPVEKVTPGMSPGAPPSDAIVLFNGQGLGLWQHADGSEAGWTVKDGYFTVMPGTGDIQTSQKFGDVQLHIEWMAPTDVQGSGQDQGNSGIFLQERYEIQVLDTYTTETYANGQAGSIYKQYAPLVNANKPPLTWQHYDIIYHAPIFSEKGNLSQPARITVLHNGILVQDNVRLLGPTEYKGLPIYKRHGKASLKLQDHGNPVMYRNVWIREL